jgi:hypothetical protein
MIIVNNLIVTPWYAVKFSKDAELMRQTANANYRPWGDDDDIANYHG